MKTAMRARDSARLSAIRLILAAIKQKEVDERVELSDADVVGILEKMIKQRRESIAQFEKPPATTSPTPRNSSSGPERLPPAAARRGRDPEGNQFRNRGNGRERRQGHGQGHDGAQVSARRPGRHGQGLGAGQSQAFGLKPGRDPRVVQAGPAQSGRHRGRGFALRPAQEGRRQLSRPLPVSRREDALVHVSPSKQFYHCFGCGAHGNAIGFQMEYGGMGYVDAVKDLAASVGMQVPELRPRTARTRPGRNSKPTFMR